MKGVLTTINATFLTLVPKADNVADPNDFKPISLCNAIDNVIKKVMAIHLKPLLPLLISPDQTNYVEGHQIMDNVILVTCLKP